MNPLPSALLLFFVILFIVPAQAQFNDTTNYYVNLASTGIVNKTNDQSSFVWNNAFKFSFYKKHASFNITQAWIYGKQQETVTNQDFATAFDFSLYKTFENFYYWGLGTYEKSLSLKINNRLQTGVGIGYNLVDKPNSLVIVSNGILYEKSDLYDNIETQTNDEYNTLRNSFRLKFRFLINEIFTIEGTDFLQHSLSDRKDYIIKSHTSISIKLLRWLHLTSSLTYNKQNRTVRENLLVNFGFTVERYF